MFAPSGPPELDIGWRTNEAADPVNLYLRLLLIMLVAPFRAACELFGPCVTPFRVMPTDLDLLFHVNNGRYLSILDLARADLVIRSKAFVGLRKQGYLPVVATAMIQFKKPLRLFQAFQVESRIIGWDSRAFIMQHRFLRAAETVAIAVVWTCFVQRGGASVSARDVLAAVGYDGADMAPPRWAQQWSELRKSGWS